jgi:tRNA-Thr(GGU) m(6)t(6)A37 methyltransferase TsaA
MITLSPIATVRNERKIIADDSWGKVISVIELLDPLNEEALEHIEDFSHVEIIFLFDRVNEQEIETGSRHPRENLCWPRVGILAQRAKNRPNRLGHTIVRIVRRSGRSLEVEGLDAIDGSPVLDIKPVMKEFLPRDEVHQPEWATELMKNYWEIEPEGDDRT